MALNLTKIKPIKSKSLDLTKIKPLDLTKIKPIETTYVASRLKDPLGGLKAIFRPAETVTPAETKQRLTEGLQFQEAERISKPLTAGIAQGYNIPDVEKTYQTTYDKYRQAGLIDEPIYRGGEIAGTKRFGVGETIGTVGKFGTAYALGGGAVEKLVSPATGALGRAIGGKVGGAVGTLATEFAKDVVIGQPLNYIEGKQKGLEGAELASYMGKQALIDIAANGVFYGVGKAFGRLGEEVATIRKGRQAVKEMTQEEIESTVNGIVKETSLPKADVEDAVKQVIDGDIQPKVQEAVDRVFKEGIQPLTDVSQEYKMSHRILYEPDATSKLNDMVNTSEYELVPKDFYDHPEWYADITDTNTKESLETINKTRNKPDETVIIYRGVPESVNDINEGDWISLSKGYADLETPKGGKVITREVKANEVIWDGNDVNEFAYFSKDAQTNQVKQPIEAAPIKQEPIKTKPIEAKKEIVVEAPKVKQYVYDSGRLKTVGEETWIAFKNPPSEKALEQLSKSNWTKVSDTAYKRNASSMTEASARMILKRLEKESSEVVASAIAPIAKVETSQPIRPAVPEVQRPRFDELGQRAAKVEMAQELATATKQAEVPKFDIETAKVDDLKAKRYELIEELDTAKKYKTPTAKDKKLEVPDTLKAEERDFTNVGDRKVKALQFENPEFKEHYEPRARELLQEAKDPDKGIKIPIYDEDGYLIKMEGKKRSLSDAMASIKDNTKASYKKIEVAIENIIKDEGAENNALSKRIELIIDDDLSTGYRWQGENVNPNKAYIDSKNSLAIKSTDKNIYDLDGYRFKIIKEQGDNLHVYNIDTKKNEIFPKDFLSEAENITKQDRYTKQSAVNKINRQIDRIDERVKGQSKVETMKKGIERVKSIDRKKLEQYKLDVKTSKTTTQFKKAESTYRTKVLKDIQALKKEHLRPEYEGSANEILDLIDTKAKSLSPGKEVTLKKTRAYFDKMLEDDPSFVINPKIQQNLDRLEKFKVNDLTTNELKDIQDTVDHILHLNKTKNTLINNNKVRSIKEVVTEMLENNFKPVEYLKGSKDLQGVKQIKDFADMYFKTGAIDPHTLMGKLSNYNKDSVLYKAYQQLEEGTRNKMAFEQKARRFIEGAGISDKDLSKEVQTFRVGTRQIKLNPQQKISLYMHSKNPQNLRHLIDGGGRTKDMAATVKFTKENIDEIISTLTVEERKLADNLGEYFDKISKDALNKTSVDLDGFNIARVNQYYPITTDKFYRSKDFSKFENSPTLEGMGILKERTTSGNPIVIEDVFDVLNRNINQVSTYSGMAIPLRNMKAVFGNSKVRRTLEGTYGKSVNSYMEDLFKNLEGGYARSNIAEDITGKLISNSQKAVLGANVKVWVNQLASLPTAMAEISPKYMLQGFKEKLPTKELMEKFSPEIWKRNKGFVTRETGELTLEGASDIFTKPIQVFDGMAIKKIWNGVEKELLDTTKLVKGSDEFYQQVARRTEEIIHRTQPNYEALYRSRAGSQKGALPKLMTLFGTQRNKNYSLMYEAIATAKATGDFSKIKKVVPSLIASSLVIAGANTTQQKLRGQEGGFGQNFASSIVSTPYLIGNVFSKIADGWDIDNMAEDSINDLFGSIGNIMDNRGNKTFAGKAKDLTEAVAKIGGVPVTNIRKYFEDALKFAGPEQYYEYQKIWENPTRTDSYKNFNKAIKDKNSELLSRISSDLRKQGVTQQQLKASMNRRNVPETMYRPYLNMLPKQ